MTSDLLADGMLTLASQVSEQREQLAAIAKRLAELSPAQDGGSGTLRCNYCRQTGHEADKCPKLLAKKEKDGVKDKNDGK